MEMKKENTNYCLQAATANFASIISRVVWSVAPFSSISNQIKPIAIARSSQPAIHAEWDIKLLEIITNASGSARLSSLFRTEKNILLHQNAAGVPLGVNIPFLSDGIRSKQVLETKKRKKECLDRVESSWARSLVWLTEQANSSTFSFRAEPSRVELSRGRKRTEMNLKIKSSRFTWPLLLDDKRNCEI